MKDLIFKELAYEVVGAAMEVHRVLGPGFPEVIYQKAFERELALQNIPYEAQKQVTVRYKGAVLADYYLDLVIDNCIVAELKAVSELASIHESQVLTYLKAADYKLGLLFNFANQRLKFKRIVC